MLLGASLTYNVESDCFDCIIFTPIYLFLDARLFDVIAVVFPPVFATMLSVAVVKIAALKKTSDNRLSKRAAMYLLGNVKKYVSLADVHLRS